MRPGPHSDPVTNDMLDFQYVVTATYFDDLASNDQRAKAWYDDLCMMLAQS